MQMLADSSSVWTWSSRPRAAGATGSTWSRSPDVHRPW